MQNCETGAAGEGVGASGKMCDSEHHLWLLLISTSFNLKNHQGKWKRHITQTRKAWTGPILRLQAFNDTRDLSDMIRCTDASPCRLKCAIRGRNWCLQLIFTDSPVAAWLGQRTGAAEKVKEFDLWSVWVFTTENMLTGATNGLMSCAITDPD